MFEKGGDEKIPNCLSLPKSRDGVGKGGDDQDTPAV